MLRVMKWRTNANFFINVALIEPLFSTESGIHVHIFKSMSELVAASPFLIPYSSAGCVHLDAFSSSGAT